MCETLISVVVPAYNSALWLPDCLDSLLAQTYSNLEILVVDDGSTDNTREVLANYTFRDDRIRAIHKENGGVTSARLRGVAEATGSWVGFVDSDDEVDPQMYARLLKNAEAHGADIAHCAHRTVWADGTVEDLHFSGDFRLQDRIAGVRDLLEDKLVEMSLCTKLFRRELFRNLEGKMDPAIKNNEDMLMNYYLFAQADKSVYEDVGLYTYRLREKSASRGALNHNRIYDPIRVRQIILEDCPEVVRDDARRALVRMCLISYGNLVLEKERENGEDRKQVRRLTKQQLPYIHLLSKRNALLTWMICRIPGVFACAYRAYSWLMQIQKT